MGNIFYYKMPIGEVSIVEENGQITELNLSNILDKKDEHIIYESEVLKEAEKQLQEYFRAERKKFSLPLFPKGSIFMKKVWEELEKIPYGKTKSYKDIAVAIGHDKAYRAVGLANNKNPIPIFIPCHRVIGSNRNLVGYGAGLDIKKYLLDLEQVKYKK